MGVLRVEPARAQQWAARSIGAIWRAYDLQLTIYALLLTGIGLAMAYSNSVESGDPTLSPGSTRALQAGDTGYDVNVWRVISKPGVADVREQYFTHYLMFPQKIARGPAPAPATAPPTPATPPTTVATSTSAPP